MTTYIPFPCKCKDCSNFSACTEYSKYLIENGHQSNSPQNLTNCSGDSDILHSFPMDVAEVVLNESFFKRLIRYFTKRDKEHSKSKEHDSSVFDGDKFHSQGEDKNKK